MGILSLLGQPKTQKRKAMEKGIQKYKLDTGEVVENKFEDGAIKLAI